MVAQKQVTVCLKMAGAVLISMLISLNLSGCGSPQQKECEPEITTVHTYLREGIDLNTGEGLTYFPGSGSIIFPQEIWSGCEHKKFSGRRTN